MCFGDEWDFIRALFFTRSYPRLPCLMTMGVCFQARRPGSQLIYLISNFIPHDSWMGSTSLGGEIYPPYSKGNGIRDYLFIQEGFEEFLSFFFP
jgi:hypothetical protein